MNKTTINGIEYSGKSISIKNGVIMIDGVDVSPDSKTVNIEISGDVSAMNIDHCNKIEVKGYVGDIKTMSGNVNVKGDVQGSINTMSGNVACENVLGSIATMSGDIKYNSL